MKNKKWIIILLIVVIFIAVCFDFAIVNYSKKENREDHTIQYRCLLAYNSNDENPFHVLDSYYFTIKDNKIVSTWREVRNEYDSLNRFQQVKANIEDIKNKEDNVTYTIDEDEMVVTKKTQVFLNEKSIDYTNEQWLDDYIQSLSMYACQKVN